MRLSIAMIVKDEEVNIERTLKAIKRLDNRIDYEIIIVDTGSTDNTINIAKKYTDKIYSHKWNGNFGDMRNISIKYCSGDWILILDADEVIEDEKEIINFLNSKDSEKYNSAEIRFKNLVSEDKNNYIIATLFRLFKRNNEFCYVGKIHEQPKVIEPYIMTNITVYHYGYSRESYELMQYKYERNRNLLLEDLKKDKNNIYARFQLAQTYSMANMNNEALNTIKEAYILDKQRKDGFLSMNVYHLYSKELLRRGNYEEAAKISKEGIACCDDLLDLFYVQAIANSALNKYEEAMVGYAKYFKIRQEKEDGTYKAKILGIESLTDYSFCKYDEVIKKYIILNYNNKFYKKVIEKNHEILKTERSYETKLLYYCSLIKEKLLDEFKDCIKNVNEDEEIQIIIDSIDKVNIEEVNFNIKETVLNIVGSNKKLDSIFKILFLNEYEKIDNLNYADYFRFKSLILCEALINNNDEIKCLKESSCNVTRNYLLDLINNYKCIGILYNYSKENMLATNIKDLAFLNIIDEVLLTSNSIDTSKYSELTYRNLINNLFYIDMVYNKDILNLDNYGYVLNDLYKMVLEIKEIIKTKGNNKLDYVRDFKKLLAKYPDYLKILTQFTKDIYNNPISTDMIKEKDNLLLAVENLFNLGNIDEGLNIIDELEKTFNMDIEIINLKGLGYYLKGNYNEALLNIGFVYSFKKDNFDVVYNLATILEEMNRKEESLYFYKKSINLCADENLKQEIELKVKN